MPCHLPLGSINIPDLAQRIFVVFEHILILLCEQLQLLLAELHLRTSVRILSCCHILLQSGTSTTTGTDTCSSRRT